MKWLKEMFSDGGGAVSSKRGLGALSLVFAMVLTLVAFFGTTPHEVSGNILAVILAFVTAGGTLLGVSLLEKK